MRGLITGVAVVLGVGIAITASSARAQTDAVTFTKDIAPILQRSCQSCHRPDSVAPMSLLTYEEVRPFAMAIKQRTALRHRRGAMPPWFIEKEIGIQRFKDDISLIRCGDCQDREMGGCRSAARQSRRPSAGASVRGQRLMADRHTRSDRHVPRRRNESDQPRLLGRAGRSPDGAVGRSLRRGNGNKGSQRLPQQTRARNGGRSLCVSPRRQSIGPSASEVHGRCTRSGATRTSSIRRPASCCGRARQSLSRRCICMQMEKIRPRT